MKQNVFLQLICFVCACSGYMPPEFLKENTFSDKNDIFSLGVIIIEIMMGPAGYSQFKGMSSVSSERSDKGMSFGKDDKKELFIDLVRNNLFLFIKTGVHDYQMLCYLAIHLLCY